MKIEWAGKVLDVGNIEGSRSVVFEVDGQDVGVSGLTIEEAREIGALLYQRVKVTITVESM
jgi:hypothetical protein